MHIRDRQPSGAEALRSTPALLAVLSLAALGCAAEVAPSEEEPHVSSAQVAPAAGERATEAWSCDQGLPEDVLVDVGHTYAIAQLTRTRRRLLSTTGDRWILWDTATGRQVTSGFFDPQVPAPQGGGPVAHPPVATPGDWAVGHTAALAGDALLEVTASGLRLRDAADGSVRFEPNLGHPAQRAGLGRDGSYAYHVEDDVVGIYDLGTGTRVEARGDFRGASATATPDGVLVARPTSLTFAERLLGGTITHVNRRGQTVTSAPYRGQLNGWFTDGRHFVTITDSAFVLYTRTGEELRAFPFDPLPPAAVDNLFESYSYAGGHGNFVWIFQQHMNTSAHLLAAQIHVFRIDDPTFVAHFEAPLPPRVSADGTLGAPTVKPAREPGAPPSANRLLRIDLRGDALNTTLLDLPPETDAHRYASDDAHGISLSYGATLYDRDGLPDAPLRSLGCGTLESISASRDGRVAVGLKATDLRIYDVREGRRTLTQALTLETRARLAADGLHAYAPSPLQLFSVSNGAPIPQSAQRIAKTSYWYMRPSAVSHDTAQIAQSACVLARSPTVPCYVEVTSRTGEAIYRTEDFFSTPNRLAFSPSARRLGLGANTLGGYSLMTYMVEAGKVLGRTAGEFKGWLDDDRVLVQRGERGMEKVYLVDTSGRQLAELPMAPSYGPISVIDAEHILTSDRALRVSDGAILANLPYADAAVISGDEVFFLRDGRIVRRRFR